MKRPGFLGNLAAFYVLVEGGYCLTIARMRWPCSVSSMKVFDASYLLTLNPGYDVPETV